MTDLPNKQDNGNREIGVRWHLQSGGGEGRRRRRRKIKWRERRNSVRWRRKRGNQEEILCGFVT